MKETNKVNSNIAVVLTHTEQLHGLTNQNKTLYLLLTDSQTINHRREKIALYPIQSVVATTAISRAH